MYFSRNTIPASRLAPVTGAKSPRATNQNFKFQSKNVKLVIIKNNDIKCLASR